MRGPMIQAIKFIVDYRCFKKGQTFEFRPGVNLVVGEQGTGKSTIFRQISDRIRGGSSAKNCDKISRLIATESRIMAFDFEKDNLRTRGHIVGNVGAQLASIFSSHGEASLAMLGAMEQEKELKVFLVDEPDMALSIRSAIKVAKMFDRLATKGHQIIAMVHHPMIIESQPEVLSVEHGKWMSSAEFITLMKSTPAPKQTKETKEQK